MSELNLKQKRQILASESPLENFKLNVVLEAANLGIWEWNLKTGGVQWTENVTGMLGLTEPFDGKVTSYLEHILQEDRESTAACINQAIRNKVDFITEHRVLLPDGTIRWIEGTGKVIYDTSGKALTLTGTVRDITERKNSEAELRHRDYLFASLATIISELINHENWETAINQIMERLGKMMNVDRVYIFENDPVSEGPVSSTSQRYEWSSTLAEPQLNNPELQHLPIEGFPGLALLVQNKAFHSHIARIDNDELRELLAGQGIVSILIFPVFIRTTFWGFIGFDDCRKERTWTDLEFSVLNSFASALSSAIERKQTTQKVVFSERSYRELFNTVDEAIYIHDMNGVLVDVNLKVLHLYGYSREELVGQTPAIFMAEGLNNLEEIAEKFQAVKAGKPQAFEWWGKKKDGTLFLKEVHTSKGIYFGKEVIIATAWDITERKKFEEVIRESELRFRTLQEASFGGIGLHDNGVLLDCNKGLCQITGYSYAELIGMDGFRLIAPEYRALVLSHVQQAYTERYDVEGIRKDGSRYFLEIQGKSIPFKGKQIRVTEFRDITARKQAEQKILEQNIRLTHMTEDLMRKNDQLEEFTQIVSHNLRSPAGNIVTLMKLYEQSHAEDERQEYFAYLKQTGDSILTTLHELNEVLKIKQNTAIERQQIDFVSALNAATSMLSGKIMESDAYITHNFADAPTVNFPVIYLESIMLNLISNSIKYRHPERQLNISLSTEDADGFIRLHVADNGLGINLEKYGHQLFKMRKTFHRHPEARGIGLFLVKNQVESMGGSIRVHSEENNGTTFTIQFTKQ
jgi:PAS domain S-box-containing protein